MTGKSFGKNFAKIEDGTVTKYGITASALNGEITISGTGQAGNYLWIKYTNGLDILAGTPSVVQPLPNRGLLMKFYQTALINQQK